MFFPEKDSNKIVINKLVGVLHLSSHQVWTTERKGYIRKEFTPFDRRFPKILVQTNHTSLQPDVFAIIQVSSVSDTNTYGVILEYLGRVRDFDDNLLLKKLSTSHWSKKADKLFEQILNVDITPNREIINNQIIYSIDPVGCVDVDDCLSCVQISDTKYQISIHIADVSSWIESDSPIDKELSERVSSIYTDSETTHMIPSILSVELMSLRKNCLKRAFSIILCVDCAGNISDIRFTKSLITVSGNLDYETAQQMIEQESDQTLVNLYRVAKIINQNISHTTQMVETYMILANNIVASHLSAYSPNNVLLRANESDNKKSIITTDNKLSELSNTYSQSNIKYVVGCDEHTMHSGLNLKYYTHFTSPIRRYADIIVHRQLTDYMNKKQIVEVDNKIIFKTNMYSKYYKKVEKYSKILKICRIISDTKDCEAHIVYFDTNYRIRIYISEFDSEHTIRLINPKLSHLISIDSDGQIMRISSDNGSFNLKLFEQITVRLTVIRTSMEKIHISLLRPSIVDFF